MSIYEYLLIIVLVLFLTSCSNNKNVQIVTQTHYVHVLVPTTLTDEIKPALPPDQNRYINSSVEERTVLLTDYVVELLKTTKLLNNRLQSIRDYSEKSKNNTQEFNEKESQRVRDLVKNKIKVYTP